MADTKHRYTADGVQILTFQPTLPAGASSPDPMKPPPFASTRPKPAGQVSGGSEVVRLEPARVRRAKPSK